MPSIKKKKKKKRREWADLQTEIKGNRVQKFRFLQSWKILMLLDPKWKEMSFKEVLSTVESINSLKCFRA